MTVPSSRKIETKSEFWESINKLQVVHVLIFVMARECLSYSVLLEVVL